ncbi:aldehyde ferredoxin oxidoreductase family protein [Neomoorella thermoacetica]|uniref:aldehyde ferredoxin oxidoreductase family protein n=1 Tax=Neomoorella thermoacetica TaxID=1525 RepID=UPI0008F9FF10|nr:aldehyde ferredoxin oxidoreductase family protein [Moorella thermoacetica]OIQ11082.1 putative oxidoreductase YdhV [Moorella thermoacetica]
MFKGGYLGKVLRVNLSNGSIAIESVDPGIYRRFLGGRGAAAYYYYQEIGQDTEPLSPDNKLIFFTGPLTGLNLPSTTKFQLATRSPMTGLYLCSNSSGRVGPHLKFAGYDGLIVEGRAAKPVFIYINNDSVEIRDAALFWEESTSRVEKRLKELAGEPRAAVMCIGPAAVKGADLACIMVDGRSFGRGGAGRVMASKNLKAVVVYGSGKIPVYDAGKINDLGKIAAQKAREGKPVHTRFGTAQYTGVMNEFGCYPSYNFRTGVFDGIDTINAEYMEKHYKVKNLACYRCPVACAQLCEVKEGPFKGFKSDPEYETIGAFGGQCGVSDFGAIVAANSLCDEYGIDTMSTGTIIAYAMECYERGLFTEKELGMKLPFGNGEAMVTMVKRMGEMEGFGAELARGFRYLAQKYPATVSYMMHAKWMPFAAYEPRGFHGIGLSYGTSSRGACHNVGGWTIRDELLTGEYDPFAVKGKGELVKAIQDTRAYIDSLGICTVVRSAMGFTNKPTGNVLALVTGHDFTPELMTIGERIYTLERVILGREGVTRAHDYLPDRIMKEKLPEGPARGHVLSKEMYDEMLDEYYRARGWDEEGRPTSERLQELGLEFCLREG